MFISWPEGGLSLDSVDKAILNMVQRRFPVVSRPYSALGASVGIAEIEAYQRLQDLRTQGYIRRLGAILDSHRLGYYSTLCAAKVPEEKIPVLTRILAEITGVTHNYLRAHLYNMWFTLIASSLAKAEEILKSVKEESGVQDIYSLPALRLFKINVDFNFKKAGPNSLNSSDTNSDANQLSSTNYGNGISIEGGCHDNPGTFLKQPYPVTEEDITLIRLLQEDLPQDPAPFQTLAAKLGQEEKTVLEHTCKLIQTGVIRRFGAVLRHQKAGFVSNAMGVWQVELERVEQVGTIMSGFPEVSHCYERPSLPDWPYNVFTMIHGQSEEECRQVIAKIAQATGVTQYDALYSLKELKKSSMRYFV